MFFGDPAVWAAYANNRTTKTGTKAGAKAVVKKVVKKPTPKPAAPAKPAPKTSPPAAAVHVVVDGDTLWGIAHTAGVTVDQLVRWNKAAYPSLGWNPNLIQVGWRIKTSAGAAA